ncbi:MAG: isoprenylcysteine carboxylmethyltransferase family protein [Halieaceae bacterium]|jgi:methanethiol S-methyltransferase|nr:isoprenylcysteine carboxylmethyltransferase family protein [Halieaceae bacterium]
MSKLLTMLYGFACYSFSMAALVLFILFANNFVGLLGVTELTSLNINSVNGAPSDQPLLVNIALLALFGIQHSVMARPGFKAMLTSVLPDSWERSTYVLATGVVTIALVWYWQPMQGSFWQLDDPTWRTLITVLYFAGWTITVLATFMLNHFHLFGLQQSFRSGDPDAGAKEFKTPAFYRLVRHPIQTGILIGMLATPDMTTDRAVLCAGMLVYMAIGLYFEERDLLAHFGDTYRDYKRRVPGVLPFIKKPWK